MSVVKSLAAFVVLLAVIFLAACGKNGTENCGTIIGNPQYEADSKNNYQCNTGEILVGYNQNAIPGPLLCATVLISCPTPTPG